MSSANYDEVMKIAQFIQSKVKINPVVGIICGSGLGKLSNAVQQRQVLAYADIPGFPTTTVVGHEGNLVFGYIESKAVVIMQGRFHPYEGYSAAEIAIPIRVMKLLGVGTVLVSNAAGGLNRKLKLGDLVVIKDHIGFPSITGNNILIGSNDDKFGPRFPAMSDAYDRDLQKLMMKICNEKRITDIVHEGVYAFLSGPTYETVAECKFLLGIGADVTGMSTVPEVIVARHCGLKVFGISLVTNITIMDYDTKQVANHQEVLEMAAQRTGLIQQLFTELIKRM